MRVFKVDLWEPDRQALKTPRGRLSPRERERARTRLCFGGLHWRFLSVWNLAGIGSQTQRNKSATVIHLRNHTALTDSCAVLGCPLTGCRRHARRGVPTPQHGAASLAPQLAGGQGSHTAGTPPQTRSRQLSRRDLARRRDGARAASWLRSHLREALPWSRPPAEKVQAPRGPFPVPPAKAPGSRAVSPGSLTVTPTDSSPDPPERRTSLEQQSTLSVDAAVQGGNPVSGTSSATVPSRLKNCTHLRPRDQHFASQLELEGPDRRRFLT